MSVPDSVFMGCTDHTSQKPICSQVFLQGPCIVNALAAFLTSCVKDSADKEYDGGPLSRQKFLIKC